MGVGAQVSRERILTRSCTVADLAWIAALPCALVLLTMIVALGPTLGDVLFAPSGMAFWPHAQRFVRPEPTEHARYALSLLGPALLAGVLLLASRRTIPSWPQALALLVPLSQVLLIAFIAACLWIQRSLVYEAMYGDPSHRAYFSVRTIVASLAIAVGLALALTRAELVRRAAALIGDTPARRLLALAVALAASATWLLMAVNSDATIGAANKSTAINLGNWMDEAVSVLDGRPPLVQLTAQYAQLWPYLTAAALALLGPTLSVFVGVMLAGTAATLLAVLALLRRIAGSWLAALALYLPFLATSFFMETGPLDNRYTPAHLFSVFPMRYGGPFVLAWLLTRHLGGARPRHRAALFLGAGLVAINNVEFGLPALLATLAALLWADPLPTWRAAALLARDVALGLAGALVTVAALTLAVAGSLPRLDTAFTYARIFGVEGFGMLPMRSVGAHLVLYVTFAAAIAVATVRAIRGEDAAPLTGMLVWSGVFGLAAGSYFVGRSHPDVLVNLFSIWALTLALLLVVVVRSATSQPRWRPSIAELALFAGAGLAICSLAQAPAPWSQLERLSRTTPVEVYRPRPVESAIAEQTDPREPVAIVMPVGHRIAHDIGIVDVTPYSDPTMPAVEQLDRTVEALRAAGGHKLFIALWLPHAEAIAKLEREGFSQTRVDPRLAMATLVDESHR